MPNELEEYFTAETLTADAELGLDDINSDTSACPYLLAARKMGKAAEDAVAVEDSAAGVGSSSNAGAGMIVGYTGASHIGEEAADDHALNLLAGTRADNGKGADIVISDMKDLPTLVVFFAIEREAGRSAPFTFPSELLESMQQYWIKS